MSPPENKYTITPDSDAYLGGNPYFVEGEDTTKDPIHLESLRFIAKYNTTELETVEEEKEEPAAPPPAIFSRDFFKAIKYHLDSSDEAVYEAFNKYRRYWQSDPTERSFKNRAKQLVGYTINVVASVGKQCINVIRKPIALTYNIGKALTTGTLALGALALGKKEARNKYWNSCKQAVKNALADTRDTIIAAATVFTTVVFIPYAAPAIVTGIAGMGAAATIIAIGLSATNNLVWINPISVRTQTLGTTTQLAYHGANYLKTGPEIYKQDEKETLKTLYRMTNDEKLSFPVKQQALEQMKKLEKHLKGESLKTTYSGRVLHSINKIVDKCANIFSGESAPHPKQQQNSVDQSKYKTK